MLTGEFQIVEAVKRLSVLFIAATTVQLFNAFNEKPGPKKFSPGF
jgi:hypothetical protein